MRDGKIIQEYRFYTIAEKTNKSKSVLIEKEILPLILEYMNNKGPDDFLFPFMPASARHLTGDKLKVKVNSRIKYVDKLLKDIARLAEINKLVTMHSARHSFADDLYEVSGDIRLVSMSLDHSDIQTTQRYLKRRSQKTVDRANSLYEQIRSRETSDDQTRNDDSQLANGTF